MITKFNNFILFENRHFCDKKYYDMESDFEPTEKVLQEIYYNELDNLYKTNINKYRLVLNILKTNKQINDKKGGKKLNFTYFKNLLKSTESKLKQDLKNFQKILEEDWYLPDIKVNNKQKQK